LKTLDLNSNKLTIIKLNWFKCSENLEELNLCSNEIKSSDEDAFDTLIYLEKLYLNFNKFTIIKSNWFKCLENLKELNLWPKSITSIDDDAFDKLIKL
jgi:Leucine-rich repeat (LRR) protein